MTDTPKLIQRPNQILQKITDGDGKIRPGGVDPAKIARAEAYIAEHAFDYKATAIDDVEALRHAFVELQQNSPRAMQTLHRLAHDMKGQAGTFGYDSLTEIAGMLADFTKNLSAPSKKHLQLIDSHIDTLYFSIARDIRSARDPQIIPLMENLHLAMTKLALSL